MNLKLAKGRKHKMTIYTHGSVKKRQSKHVHVSIDVKVCVLLTVLDITVNLEKVLNFHIQNKSLTERY
jgi:hypothetical protein